MPYADLLLSDEWKSRRNQILQRDGYKCQNCYNEKYLSEFKKGFMVGINIRFLRPIELENSFMIKIFTQLGEKRSYSLSYIRKDIGFQTGISSVAYYKEIEDSLRSVTVALKKTTIKNPIILKRNEEEDNEEEDDGRIFVLSDEANTEIASRNWKTFEWMFVLGLHVHHKYYVAGKNPWEYPDEALVTLCWHCHEEQHKGSKIMECDEDGQVLRELTYCFRCNGAGVFPEYAHVDQGICFRCNGARFEELIEEPN